MRSNTGFTLLEILIALAILVIGVAAVINLFPIGLHASKRAADFTMVAILGQEKIAELMYLGYDRLNEIEGIDNFPDPNDPEDSGGQTTFATDEAYSWWLRLDGDALVTVNNLYLATLQIYWLDRGVERYATFVTYIADYEA